MRSSEDSVAGLYVEGLRERKEVKLGDSRKPFLNKDVRLKLAVSKTAIIIL